MLTGDASINHEAPIICCTAEVLSNMALRQGEALDAPYVVMDEFHYYSDRERGMAWQIPLLSLPNTTFLLMSATLGSTVGIEEDLQRRTGREIAHVTSRQRPVPLDFEYREKPLHETRREAGARGEGAHLRRELHPARVRRAGPGPHQHDGRRAARSASASSRPSATSVSTPPTARTCSASCAPASGCTTPGCSRSTACWSSSLSQQGLLKVICGTDTLGVGVNIPIRTVLFTRLCKFDGEKTTILSVRDFKQIAGRAGRKGFDERGSVVCQAPEYVVLNRRAEAKAADPRSGRKKAVKVKPPTRGFLPWNQDTFQRLIYGEPEPLVSRFQVTHGMLVSVLQSQAEAERPGGGYRTLFDLIGRSHQDDRSKHRLRREAAVLFRALRRAGIVEIVRDPRTGRRGVRVHEELQRDFSLHQTLSLYLVDAASALDPASPNHALDVLSIVEGILDNPRPVLLRQVDQAKKLLLAELKAQGVPYEDRIRELDEVTWPKPLAEFLYSTFDLFAEKHPWLEAENIRPKSIAREMAESFMGFHDYVRTYGLERSEGLLLRYLSQVHSTLSQSVPETLRTDDLEEIRAYLRAMLEQVDASLVEEWESLVHPEAGPATGPAMPQRRERDLAADPRVFAARIRQEWHRLVQALATREWEEAARCVRQDAEDPWEPRRFHAALLPFFEEYGEIVTTPDARRADRTTIRQTGPRSWDVMQTLVDPNGDELWALFGSVDLSEPVAPDEPIITMQRIGT